MIEVVLALGIVAAVLVFLFHSFGDAEGKSHYALKIIILGFLLWVIVLLGKSAIDYQEDCSHLLANETTTYSYLADNSTINTTTTINNYSYVCSAQEKTTATSLFKASLWIARLTAIYLIMTFAFEVILYFGWWKKGGKQE